MTDTDLSTDLADREPALNDREWTLISRLNQICVLAARLPSRDKVLEEIALDWRIGRTEAEKWLRKGEEFMASGVVEGVDMARRMYHMRLSEIYGTAMKHAVKDQVKVTTKPTRVIVDGVDEDGKPMSRVITAQHTEIRPNSLDTAALQVALRAAREAAHILGVSPNRGRRGVQIEQVNLNIGSGVMGNNVMDMANDQLAALLGAQVIDAQAEVIDGPGHAGVLSPTGAEEDAADAVPERDDEGQEAHGTGDS